VKWLTTSDHGSRKFMTPKKIGANSSSTRVRKAAQGVSARTKREDADSQGSREEEPSHPFRSQILGCFLKLLKEKTGSDASPTDAIFHRKYAKYRQMLFPDAAEEMWRSAFMHRTWINVLLHDGMTDELRKELYPGRFDLGNTQSDNDTRVDFSELLREINGAKKEGRGENVGGKEKKDFGTVLKGIEATVNRRIGDGAGEMTVADLKVVKLLYRISKERAPHLFGLIAHPSRADNATLEFRDSFLDRLIEEPSSNDERIEENELLVADLIAYLSAEIPDGTLKAIHALLLTHSKLLECVVIENDALLHPIRAACTSLRSDPANVYFFLAQLIQLYPNIEPSTRPNSLSEALYTYLRSLHFQHFVGGYADIVEKAVVSDEIKAIGSEIERFCEELAEANMLRIGLNTPITSIEEFPTLVKRHSTRFRSLIKSATGLATRDDALDDICSHASKILNAYMWVQFTEKDLSKECISVADCLAALIAVRHQQSVKTNYKPRWFGLKDVGDSPLRYFDRERSVRDLQATDYIPEGVNQLLYQRFCQAHLLLVGDQNRHESWMTFQVARLRQYAQCMQSNNLSSISASINHLNEFCSNVSNLLAYRILKSAA
jgi:hypothetical protein